MKTAIIEVDRVNPESDHLPPPRIFARMALHPLKMPDGGVVNVFAIDPLDKHPENERKYISANFPFFQRRILTGSDDIYGSVGGYLLSLASEGGDDDRFDSYFASAEALLTPSG